MSKYMAKKIKTRKQKIASQKRKSIQIKPKNTVKIGQVKDENILIVDEKFIKKDIEKTVVISIVFTFVLLGIWWWMK